tara:strand:- start:458 stop:1549 length:1092 start_codon:yes stop_codon:yes gene_type:complete
MNIPHPNKPDQNFWDGKKVLITGHTGFKGSWLALWLLKMNSKVNGISLDPIGSHNLFDQLKIKKDLNHIVCDIRDRSSLKNHFKEIKPDVVFHLAAQPLVVKSYKDPLQTWETNLMGTINVLDAIKSIKRECSGIFITTDKVYKNKEWVYGYRENDELGGHDPYSSSKAACELAISSWRSSFFNQIKTNDVLVSIASARAGNVIGGGDSADNRIIPDVIRSLKNNEKIKIRNPFSTRPWQHVLEPLSGYLILAENLKEKRSNLTTSFNFGPLLESNRTVKELVEECLKHWEGDYYIEKNLNEPHEAVSLHLTIEKSKKDLGWVPKWDFGKTIEKTVKWYKKVHSDNISPLECSLENLNEYLNE